MGACGRSGAAGPGPDGDGMRRGFDMQREQMDLVKGTLDMLVLKALQSGARHGYDIMRWLRATSGEDLNIEEGALYPALHRMEERGLIEAEWGTSDNNRRAKYYQITAAGRAQLLTRTAVWERYVNTVARILATA